MKYWDTTANTGHRALHDTDASIADSIWPDLAGLLAAGGGFVPGAGRLRYRLSESQGVAILSVETELGMPCWIAAIAASDPAARAAEEMIGIYGI